MPCALDALELRPIGISEFFYKNEEVQGVYIKPPQISRGQVIENLFYAIS
jgi:hypothetical protein